MTDLRSLHRDVNTENQVRPHASFATGKIHARSAGSVRRDGERTQVLAKPPAWSQRDDRPCLNKWTLFDAETGITAEYAEKMCSTDDGSPCPVKAECLADALAWEEGLSKHGRYGIRGGLTPTGRAELAGAYDECRRGHDMTDEDNIYENPSGGRRCRKCLRENNSAQRARSRGAGRVTPSKEQVA